MRRFILGLAIVVGLGSFNVAFFFGYRAYVRWQHDQAVAAAQLQYAREVAAAKAARAARERKLAAVTQESKVWAEQAATAIAARWDDQAMLRLAAPNLRRVIIPDGLHKLFHRFSTKLGPEGTGQSCEGSAYMSAVDHAPGYGAFYSCRERYKNGEAQIQLWLAKGSTGWGVDALEVKSPLLDAP